MWGFSEGYKDWSRLEFGIQIGWGFGSGKQSVAVVANTLFPGAPDLFLFVGVVSSSVLAVRRICRRGRGLRPQSRLYVMSTVFVLLVLFSAIPFCSMGFSFDDPRRFCFFSHPATFSLLGLF